MTKKKEILIMRGYFFPENAASNHMCLDFIKALADEGFHVTVLCPIPTRGVSDEVRNAYRRKRCEELESGITIKRFYLPKESGSVAKRMGRYFMQNMYQLSYALVHQYDLMFLYSTPPTNGVVGGVLRCLKGKPFIYNLHDVFPDSMANMGIISQKSAIWKMGRKMENFSYRHADRIIAVSDSIKQNIVEKNVPSEKVDVVYNWVDENQIIKITREKNTIFTQFGIDRDKFVITYAGNIGEAQGVTTIMKAAILLKGESQIHFLIIGDGAKEDECKKLAEENQLKNVTFIPMQPQDRLSEVYSAGDVSLVACKAGFGNCGMPSKTGSIMSAGTAVVASFDMNSELSQIITKSQAGICVEPDNATELADVLKRLSYDVKLCKKYGENGRNYLINHMTKNICTQKLINNVKSFLIDKE